MIKLHWIKTVACDQKHEPSVVALEPLARTRGHRMTARILWLTDQFWRGRIMRGMPQSIIAMTFREATL
jgi:hypothetical protein